MEIFNIDFASVLIFVVPGYYFLAFAGLKFKTGMAWAVNSLFFGILLAFTMNYIYPIEKYQQLLNNPLAAAAVLSLWGILLGFGLRFIIDPIKEFFAK